MPRHETFHMGAAPVHLQTPSATAQISLLQGKRAEPDAVPRAPYTLENGTFILTAQTCSDTPEQGGPALGEKRGKSSIMHHNPSLTETPHSSTSFERKTTKITGTPTKTQTTILSLGFLFFGRLKDRYHRLQHGKLIVKVCK